MSPPDNLPDDILLQRITSGNEPAFEQFYDRYKRLVFSLTLHILRDSNTAEDVTLDIFTRVWTQAANFQPNLASAKTWLMTIARHAAIDQLRRLQVRQDQNPAFWVDDALETLPATGNVEAEVAEQEIRQQVQCAIDRLPAEQREVLARAYFNGDSHSQIATALNQPLGTVKGRIRTAMMQLRAELNREA